MTLIPIFLRKHVPGIDATRNMADVGELIIDENYIAEPCDVPIDTLVLTINRESEEDNENEVEVELDGDE